MRRAIAMAIPESTSSLGGDLRRVKMRSTPIYAALVLAELAACTPAPAPAPPPATAVTTPVEPAELPSAQTEPAASAEPVQRAPCGRPAERANAPSPSTGPAEAAAAALPETASGGYLAPEIIQRAVRASYPRLRTCYEDDLRPCPNLSGRVTVRFVIAASGIVAAAQAEADGVGSEVARCVENVVRRMVFPEPTDGPVTVSYPIVFAPGQ